MNSQERKQVQDVFLIAFAAHANVSRACAVAMVSRTQVYEWMKDANFKTRYGMAEEDANDALEYSAHIRAVEGVDEPLVSVGKIVRDDSGQPIMMKKYSDQLLITLLKARLPHKYKDKQQVELSGIATLKTVWGGGSVDDVDEVKGGSGTTKTIE